MSNKCLSQDDAPAVFNLSEASLEQCTIEIALSSRGRQQDQLLAGVERQVGTAICTDHTGQRHIALEPFLLQLSSGFPKSGMIQPKIYWAEHNESMNQRCKNHPSLRA